MAIKVQNTTVISDTRQILNVTGFSVTGNVVATGSIDAGTQFLGRAADTNTAPSFSWTGDTNTGIFRPVEDAIGFSIGGSEIARLSTGGLSIGSSANSVYSLSIFNDSSFTLGMATASDTADPAIRMFRSRGTRTAPTPITTNAVMGGLRFFGSQNTSPTQSMVLSAAIDAYAAENFSETTRASYINFRTTNPNSLTISEKMRITANGNVGIGTSSPSDRLSVVGNTLINGLLTVNRNDDQQLVLRTQSSLGNPRLEFYSNTFFRGYVAYDHPSQVVRLANEGFSTYLDVGNGESGLVYYSGVDVRTVWHSGNDGTGSGLDADLLDGVQGASFLRSDANDTASGLISFDRGAGTYTDAFVLQSGTPASGNPGLFFKKANSNTAHITMWNGSGEQGAVHLYAPTVHISGSTGIGTTAPSEKLHVEGTTRSLSFAAANGSATSPAFDFAADTNTGMFLAAADTLGFATNGTTAAQFTSTGNLRLFNTAGTFYTEISAQPTANRTLTLPNGNVTLVAGTMVTTDTAQTISGRKTFTDTTTLFGDDGTNGYARIDKGTSTNPGFVAFYTADDVRRGYVGWNFSNNLGIATENGWGLSILGGNTVIDGGTLFVDHVNNRVGVGTTAPEQALDVAGVSKATSGFMFGANNHYWYEAAGTIPALRIGSAGPFLAFEGIASAAALIRNASGDLAFGAGPTTGAEYMRIRTTGNVGIGTTAASEKLHVEGTTRSLSFSAANGAVTAPAFDFAADPNTGMFLLAADTLGFATNGTAAGAFTSTGDLRLYNTAGNRFITISNQPTANVTITIPVLTTNSNFVLSEGTATINGAKTFSNIILSAALTNTGTNSRDKLRVWASAPYSIGMSTPFTFGPINNDYAMTFQMNDASTRGFWWGDLAHANNQGAMALSTDGKLTVATAIRAGYGESDTTVPAAIPTLDITGNMQIAGSASGGHWINFVETGTNDRFGIGAAFSGTGDSNRFFISANNTGAIPNIADAALIINQDKRILIGSDTVYGETGVIPKLQLSGSVARNSRIGFFHWQDNVNSGSIEFNKSRSSVGEGNYAAVQSGDHLATLVAKGADGNTFVSTAYMFVDAEATATVNRVQSRFEFWTTGAQDTNPAQRAVIGGGGIGLDVTGTIRASTGILFGTDTATANILDDYEEGSWTPVLSDGTNNATMNGTLTIGRYTKIGRLVTCTARVATTALGSVSGALRITGLPFTNLPNDNGSSGTCNVSLAQGLAITAGQSITGRSAPNTDYILLYLWDTATGTSSLLGTEWSSDGDIFLTVTYTASA